MLLQRRAKTPEYSQSYWPKNLQCPRAVYFTAFSADCFFCRLFYWSYPARSSPLISSANRRNTQFSYGLPRMVCHRIQSMPLVKRPMDTYGLQLRRAWPGSMESVSLYLIKRILPRLEPMTFAVSWEMHAVLFGSALLMVWFDCLQANSLPSLPEKDFPAI